MPGTEQSRTAGTLAVLSGFAQLLGFWALGELFVRLSGLPLPGPVAGMLLLLGTGLFRRRIGTAAQSAGQHLLQHLSLLFVPAAVGIVEHTDTLQREGWAMLLTLVLSTAITLAVTALVLHWMTRKPA